MEIDAGTGEEERHDANEDRIGDTEGENIGSLLNNYRK